MKKLIMTAAILFGVFTMNAQNKNVLKETETKTTTIKDSKGEKKIVKSVETEEEQKVELEMSEQKGINIPIKEEAPVKVKTTTQVAVDGDVKFKDVDRSAYYSLNGNKYEIRSDDNGYVFVNPKSKGKNKVFLRKTSNNNYFYVTDNQTSFAYFDADGNLVLESYDKKNDTVTMQKYMVVK